MTSRRVPRALAEEAVLLIQRTYVDYRRSAASLPPRRGRIGAGTISRLAVAGPLGAARQSCWLRLMSIVEAYLDLLSSDTFRGRLPSRDELTNKLLESVEARSTATWDERKNSFDRYHGVSFGDVDGWDAVNSAVPVRNAIAHGLGRLTPQQDIKKTTDTAAKIGVRVIAGAMVIDEVALQKCRDSCVVFIKSVDLETD